MADEYCEGPLTASVLLPMQPPTPFFQTGMYEWSAVLSASQQSVATAVFSTHSNSTAASCGIPTALRKRNGFVRMHWFRLQDQYPGATHRALARRGMVVRVCSHHGLRLRLYRGSCRLHHGRVLAPHLRACGEVLPVPQRTDSPTPFCLPGANEWLATFPPDGLHGGAHSSAHRNVTRQPLLVALLTHQDAQDAASRGPITLSARYALALASTHGEDGTHTHWEPLAAPPPPSLRPLLATIQLCVATVLLVGAISAITGSRRSRWPRWTSTATAPDRVLRCIPRLVPLVIAGGVAAHLLQSAAHLLQSGLGRLQYSERILFYPPAALWVPAVYPNEPDVVTVAELWYIAIPEMVPLLVACAISPFGLLWLGRRSRAVSIAEGISLAAMGYAGTTLQMYWSHRYTHYVHRAALVGAVANGPTLPACVAAFYGAVGLFDHNHPKHHVSPALKSELMETLGERAPYAAIALVLVVFCGPCVALERCILHMAQTAPPNSWYRACTSGGRRLVTVATEAPLVGVGDIDVQYGDLDVQYGARARRADQIHPSHTYSQRWLGVWASVATGVSLACTAYQVVHLASHIDQRSVPAWLSAWASAHRLHHRNPSGNFGFIESGWDWVFGTLIVPEVESCAAC